MFGRRKQQQAQQFLQEAEQIRVTHVLQKASDISFPGDVITPEDVRRAANMVGMEVVEGATQGGASARDCATLMSLYTEVGDRASSLFAVGGPMHGATSPPMDER